MRKLSSPKYIPLKYAALTTALLSLYFGSMMIIGLAERPIFRVLNIFILYWGIHLAVSKAKSIQLKEFNFLTGYKTGIQTGILTTIMFSILIVLFDLINAPFIERILSGGKIENAGTIFEIIGIISIEAISSTFICTYICIQWLKEPRYKKYKA